jgi:two-component system sensor histidine kinase VicK
MDSVHQNPNIEALMAMMHRAEEVFFVFDADQSSFTYLNDAVEALTKREKNTFLKYPKSLLKIIHKEDLSYVKHNLKLLPGKTASLLDFRICRPDKTDRWIRLKLYSIGEMGKVAGIAHDDSARKASIFNMQKINGWKNANLEIIAHDLRGPIGIVQMLSSVIGKKMPENKDIQKLTQLIAQISERNISLIQNVLSNEAIDTAAVEISKERLDVVWEVHQALDIYIEAQKNLNKRIIYTHSHDQIYAEVDSMKFLQVVNNLMSNAIKFTEDNGVVKVHLEKLDHSFLMTVADNGLGIPKSLQPILFRKYTPAARAGVEGEQPVGLGMWIVKKLTEAHNGRVWFESEQQIGSTFFVEIPLGK